MGLCANQKPSLRSCISTARHLKIDSLGMCVHVVLYIEGNGACNQRFNSEFNSGYIFGMSADSNRHLLFAQLLSFLEKHDASSSQ